MGATHHWISSCCCRQMRASCASLQIARWTSEGKPSIFAAGLVRRSQATFVRCGYMRVRASDAALRSLSTSLEVVLSDIATLLRESGELLLRGSGPPVVTAALPLDVCLPRAAGSSQLERAQRYGHESGHSLLESPQQTAASGSFRD